MIALTVNGETRRTAAATIADLVRELDLDPAKVAVEHNGTIAPRSELGRHPISDGDTLLCARAGDSLSASAAPIAMIGQLLAVLGAGLPLLAAARGWVGHDLALNAWMIGLWLAAAFKLYRFMPGPARAD